MAIEESDNEIKPTALSACRRTYVRAKGTATALAKTAAAAVREAREQAKVERDRAMTRAKQLRCIEMPCSRGKLCRDNGTTKTGFADDWTSYSLYRHCHCE